MHKSHLQINTNEFIQHVKSNYTESMPLVFWIDLFCGAGGTSTGIHLSNAKNVFVAACVNHDANAIKSHSLNHPHTLHFTEDIRDFAVIEQLEYFVAKLRVHFPQCKLKIWASLECTNFSKAKGGMARDADSRTLAEHMTNYMALSPDVFWFENVREFLAWGPLDKNGKPVSKNNGRDYLKWVETIQSYGYGYDKKILNSADYGAFQSRERLFIQFPKKGIPYTWPEQTHSKKGGNGSLFDIPKWKPVRDVLDLSDEGQSIFSRKKPLSENTEKRILAGLIKFIAKGDTTFIQKYFSGRPEGKVISVNEPAGTVTTAGTQAVVKVDPFTMQYNSGNYAQRVKSLDEPVNTITTGNSHAIVVPKSFLNSYYGNGGAHDIENPSPTVTCKDRISKINIQFLDANSSTSPPVGLDTPSPSVTSRTHLLINPSWFGHSTSTDEPSPTIIARQDKAPMYLLAVESGPVAWVVFEDDTPTMIKIKEFMVAYGITDIKMRMLKIPELLQIQGFPKDYKLVGTQTEQKKYIGNAVEVNMAKALAFADYELEIKIAA
ncbi:MAG: DNA cytosine methyltransferase [Bacteroidetes bacterium]|nr:DNA cytosine methyltransferase [Bacteroidota bacterium]